MFVYIALAVSTTIAIVAVMMAIRAQMQIAVLRNTLEIFGRIIKRLPGVQEIVEDELAKAQIIVEHIDAITKRVDQTFRERFPF